MRKNLTNYVLLFFLLLLLLPIVESVGITGKRLVYTEFFVPNGEFKYTFNAKTTKDNQEVIFTSAGVLNGVIPGISTYKPFCFIFKIIIIYIFLFEISFHNTLNNLYVF